MSARRLVYLLVLAWLSGALFVFAYQIEKEKLCEQAFEERIEAIRECVADPLCQVIEVGPDVLADQCK